MRENDLKKFSTTDRFLGYRNKTDVTQEDKGVAVSGSQNCIIVDGRKIGVRPGFEYIGGRSTDRFGIQGGGSWKNSSGDQIMWRSYHNGSNGVIEIFYNGAFEILDQSFTGAKFRETTFWDNTEKIDLLVLVNGTSSIYTWSGAIATFASATANTITLQGTETFGEKRFLTAGTRKARVKDDSGVWREFTYTGGETTTTLTGVTVDLTAFTISAGAPIFQSIRESANQPSSTAKNDFCINYLNQLYVFSETNRNVLGSKVNDFDDFSAASSPRLPGEAITFNLDEEPTGAAVAPTGSSLYITTRNYYYQFTLVDSSDLTKQSFNIDPTYIPFGGASNPLAISNIKNYITMITKEPTFDTLGNMLNTEGVRSASLSDDIKNYMDASEVDEASSSYFKNNCYLSIKSSSDFGSNNNLLVRNLQNGYFETPWTIPTLKTFEHEGFLYAHDPSMKNTFKLLTGYSDGKNGIVEGAPISAKHFSPHDNYGLPENQKEFDVIWINGYITPNTLLDFYLTYDFGSFVQKFTLKGTDTATGVVLQTSGGGLGYYSLGNRSLGGRGESLASTGLRRFRGFITVPVRPFYEFEWSVQSVGVNFRWELCAFSPNIRLLTSENNNLKLN